MMSARFVILVILIIRAVTLPGAEDGLAFYLMPDFSKMFANGAAGFGDAVYAAMGQSFFTPVSYTHLDVYKRQRRSCRTGS